MESDLSQMVNNLLGVDTAEPPHAASEALSVASSFDVFMEGKRPSSPKERGAKRPRTSSAGSLAMPTPTPTPTGRPGAATAPASAHSVAEDARAKRKQLLRFYPRNKATKQLIENRGHSKSLPFNEMIVPEKWALSKVFTKLAAKWKIRGTLELRPRAKSVSAIWGAGDKISVADTTRLVGVDPASGSVCLSYEWSAVEEEDAGAAFPWTPDASSVASSSSFSVGTVSTSGVPDPAAEITTARLETKVAPALASFTPRTLATAPASSTYGEATAPPRSPDSPVTTSAEPRQSPEPLGEATCLGLLSLLGDGQTVPSKAPAATNTNLASPLRAAMASGEESCSQGTLARRQKNLVPAFGRPHRSDNSKEKKRITPTLVRGSGEQVEKTKKRITPILVAPR